MYRKTPAVIIALILVLAGSSAAAVELEVTVENLQGSGGLFTTPLWVGFHDGSFDSYDTGSPASPGLERIAEDGNAELLSQEFGAAAPSGLDGLILDPAGFAGAPVFDPGNTSRMVFDIDPATQQYFSYATMVIPSNDAFVANANPTAHPLFDNQGNFVGPISFVVYGTQVRDAGTEENSETEAAFLNQSGPDMGISTDSVVTVHPGFNGSVGNPEATPVNILGGTTAAGTQITQSAADFTANPERFSLLRITISESNRVPLRLTIQNSAPAQGVFLTPFWVGFHNGEFDSYDGGSPASSALERIAEDGNTGPISDLFQTTATEGFDTVITDPEGFGGAPLFEPQSKESMVVELNPETQRYFSYVSMLIPSNDAFIANGNPTAHQIFDSEGNFNGPFSFSVVGAEVNDAGTEANTESDAAFFDQNAPDSGEVTADVITIHPGFNGSVGNPAGSPQRILGGTNGAGIFFDQTAADFSIEDYTVATISIDHAIDGSLSGLWYNPERAGEAINIEITTDTDGTPRLVISYLTHSADGSGNQAWVVGSGPIVGQTGIADVFMTRDGMFGEPHNPDAVNVIFWGQLKVEFNGCDNAVLNYDSVLSDYGSGTDTLKRLSGAPFGLNTGCAR